MHIVETEAEAVLLAVEAETEAVLHVEAAAVLAAVEAFLLVWVLSYAPTCGLHNNIIKTPITRNL